MELRRAAPNRSFQELLTGGKQGGLAQLCGFESPIICVVISAVMRWLKAIDLGAQPEHSGDEEREREREQEPDQDGQ